MRNRLITAMILAVFIMSGCTTYKTQYAGFRPPEDYINNQVVNGISIGGEAYANRDVAEDAFGFDIKGAGLLPVQLVLNNNSGATLEVVANQTFLVDDTGKYWTLIPTGVAIERLEESTQLASFFGKGAGKGALIGAAAGSVIGAALGIVSGTNVGSALGKGAALGAAGGAVIGGVKEGTSGEREYRITDDLRTKSLEGKTIPTAHLANGFLFFPGEAESAKSIRLQLRETGTGKIIPIVLRLK
ncbi:hypothetical protein OR1_00841 [Geobacter sp. OR-1]|uniref:hypothetical protein n=1 Tax=Geobacter sp. OR-1 TaxID=1266765 RepID=UPI000542F782|nr:hypothetical protein [Geobacter sp. OR-1]GAM08569.1 hypothetical protein OR1_00841 [Geobacter sp. OR-1]